METEEEGVITVSVSPLCGASSSEAMAGDRPLRKRKSSSEIGEVILVDAARAKVAKPALRKTASGTTTASPRAAASRTSPRHSPMRPTASPLKFAAKTSVATLDEEVAEEEAVVDDDDMPCDVCRCTASGDVGNPMVYCDGCGVGVHVWCYGTSEDKLPEGDWFCDGCNWAAENNPRVAPQCCLCPSTGGALALVAGPKKPTSQRFAHISCAISLQAEGHRITMNFEDGFKGLGPALLQRNPQVCTLCGEAGGGVVKCNYHDCIAALWKDGRGVREEQRTARCPRVMHPRCASDAGWLTFSDASTGLAVTCCGNHSAPHPVRKLHAEQFRRAAADRAAFAAGDQVDESRTAQRRTANKLAEAEAGSSDGLTLRRCFLWEKWPLFAPFLDVRDRPRTGRLALQVLGSELATDDPAPALAARARIAHPDPPTSQPACVVGGTMRGYQVDGLQWMVRNDRSRVGGILGDEMGLGKTLQVCSFFAYLVAEQPIGLGEKGPFLVVCPLSVLETWLSEIRRWCPGLRAVRYHGNERERKRLMEREAAAGQFDVLCTSYETLVADPGMFQTGRFWWRYVVMDEAQRIKNERTLVGKAVRRLKTSGKLLLTGTPLQNTLRELWALLNFLFPDVLKEATGFEGDGSGPTGWGVGPASEESVAAARELLEPLMLRRTKKSVGLAIPPKREIRILAALSPTQYEWYEKILANDAGLISNLGQASGGTAADFTRLANMLMQLRKVASHPWLLPGAEPPELRKSKLTDGRIVTHSGKMVVLDKLLVKLRAENRKVVVFSQFTTVLDMIEDYLRYRGFGYFRLDGGTSVARRRFQMAQFQGAQLDKFVFLVSTRAGGLGLNLQAADTVILFDNDWNPQADLQAQDRVHRMGQTRPVTVFRFISAGTCEERIMAYAEKKLELSINVLQDHDREVVSPGAAANDDDDVTAVEGEGDKRMSMTAVPTGVSKSDVRSVVYYGMDSRKSASDGEAFRRLCEQSIEEIIEPVVADDESVAADGDSTAEAAAVEWQTDIRAFDGKAVVHGRTKSTEEEWTMGIANRASRQKKATTVDDDGIAGFRGVKVSKWSIDALQKEVAQAASERARIDADKKKVLDRAAAPRLPFCAVCREKADGPHVKASTLMSKGFDGNGDGTLRCRHCPAVAHLTCVSFSDLSHFGWTCPHSGCCLCDRRAADAGGLLFRCVKCPRAFCDDCVPRGFVACPSDPALEKIPTFKHSRGLEFIECTWCEETGGRTAAGGNSKADRAVAMEASAAIRRTRDVAPSGNFYVSYFQGW